MVGWAEPCAPLVPGQPGLRNKSYITYTQADLFYMGLLKSVCGQHTMHGMKTYFGKVFVSLKGLADGGVFQGLPGNFSNSS